MTSPVRGNFGHIREPGVLLLTKEDSKIKHQRNAILAGKSFLALFSVGVLSGCLSVEGKFEHEVREINRKHYPNLPYAMCVLLRNSERVEYEGVQYESPYRLQDEADRERMAYDLAHPEEVRGRQAMISDEYIDMSPDIDISLFQ